MSSAIPHIVADIEKNKAERIRVALSEFNGVPTIDIRQWFFSRDNDEPHPTKKGLTVAVKHLPALATALSDALAEARARGLIREQGG